MKKLIYFLLLIPFIGLGQVSTGQEQFFDYGIQVEPTALQSISTPTYYGCIGVDGTVGKTPAANVTPTSRTLNINGVSQDLSSNREWRTAQADSGVLTFGGITAASTTQINIGAVTGYVVNNETTPGTPTHTFVNYSGETNKTVTTLGSGIITYVLLNSSGVIVFQNTFPTPTQRKANIFLGKIGHPTGVIGAIGNEPDFITSPLAQYRDLAQALAYVNTGIYPYPSAANLTFATTTGSVYGDGINFTTDKTNPNYLARTGTATTTFLYRTGNGTGGGAVTNIDPTNYNPSGAGTISAVGGASGNSTIQYIFAVPSSSGVAFIVQYGQTIYPTLASAVSSVGKEVSFTVYPNLVNDAILVGALCVNRSATDLTNTSQALFFRADKFGQMTGSQAGVSTGTLQTAYNNSSAPQITTSTALGAVEVRRGSAADTDTVLKISNGAGTQTLGIKGNGDTILTGQLIVTSDAATGAVVGESVNNYGGYFTNNSSTKPGAVIQNQSGVGDIAHFMDSSTIKAKVDKSGNITANSFVKSGGTSTQGLLADGSVLTNPMDLGSSQTVTGVKTFLSGNIGHRNVANTFTSFFSNAATASRTWTMPDKNGTVAMTSDIPVPITGTVNNLIKFGTTSTGVDSRLKDDGTYLGIGSVSPIALSKDIQLGRQSDKEIGVEQSNSLASGKNLTISAGRTINFLESSAFIALSQGNRSWSGMCSTPIGNVYACVNGGDIYKQTGGTGSFVALGQTVRSWTALASDASGNIYATVNNGDIYKQTGGTGNFVATGQTTRTWSSIAVAPNGDIYATTGAATGTNGDVYKQTGGTGSFVALGLTPRKYNCITILSNNDIYVSGYTEDIYKQTNSTGAFNALGVGTSIGWSAITSIGLDVYITGGGNGWSADIYKQTNATGSFVSQSYGGLQRTGLTSNGVNLYYTLYNGDIYFQNNNSLGTSNLNGGALIAQSGTGKGTGQSRFQVYTGQKTASGTDMQVSTKRLEIDEDGRSTFFGAVTLKGYTVSTLPTGVIGDTAYVTDATAPTFLSTVVGGGSVVTPVFYNGTNWICH